jgi:hypothetical protein
LVAVGYVANKLSNACPDVAPVSVTVVPPTQPEIYQVVATGVGVGVVQVTDGYPEELAAVILVAVGYVANKLSNACPDVAPVSVTVVPPTQPEIYQVVATGVGVGVVQVTDGYPEELAAVILVAVG